MTPAEAAQLLGVSPDAAPAQLEARFLELRATLEEKTVRAPTPGLKAKYRESLDQVTAAFETLTLAADSSSLPVAQKSGGPVSPRAGSNVGPDRHRPGDGGSPLAATSPTRSAPAPTLQAKPKSGGKEFLVVATLAVILLGAGGWWVFKTRAENAAAKDRAEREAATAKAESERQAELTRTKLEQERVAREAAIAAERERAEKLYTSLRSRTAELSVAYEAMMRTETVAERELAELKSQERDLARDSQNTPSPQTRLLAAQIRAQNEYLAWLRDTLPVHTAKVARARLEELLSARAIDDATKALDAYTAGIEQMKADLATARKRAAVTGTLQVAANLPGSAVKVTDAYGAQHDGPLPARFSHVAAGPADLVFTAPNYPPKQLRVAVSAGESTVAQVNFRPGRFEFLFEPANARAEPVGSSVMVIEPGRVFEALPGPVPFRVTAAGYAPRRVTVEAVDSQTQRPKIVLSRAPIDLLKAEALESLSSAPDAFVGPLAQGSGRPPALSVVGQLFIDTDDREGFAAFADVVRRRSPRLGLSEDDLKAVLRGTFGAYPRPSTPRWLQEEFPGPREDAHTPKGGWPKEHRRAAELIAAGKDPRAAGLTDAILDRDATALVDLLAELQQPALAERWLQRWHELHPGNTGTDAGGLVAVFTIMDAWIRLGDASRAISVFNRYRAYNLLYDVDDGLIKLLRRAGAQGDRVSFSALSAFLAELQPLPAPQSYHRNQVDQFWRWEDSLRQAGRGDAAHEARLLAELRPNPPPAPAGLATTKPRALSPFVRGEIALSLAKRRASRGETSAAFEAAALAEANPIYFRLANTFAAAGDLTASLESLAKWNEYGADTPNGQSPVSPLKRYYQFLASVYFGRGLAERQNESRALKAIADTTDPALRLIAQAAYVTRRYQIEQLTPEQREFIRTLPPL